MCGANNSNQLIAWPTHCVNSSIRWLRITMAIHIEIWSNAEAVSSEQWQVIWWICVQVVANKIHALFMAVTFSWCVPHQTPYTDTDNTLCVCHCGLPLVWRISVRLRSVTTAAADDDDTGNWWFPTRWVCVGSSLYTRYIAIYTSTPTRHTSPNVVHSHLFAQSIYKNDWLARTSL